MTLIIEEITLIHHTSCFCVIFYSITLTRIIQFKRIQKLPNIFHCVLCISILNHFRVSKYFDQANLFSILPFTNSIDFSFVVKVAYSFFRSMLISFANTLDEIDLVYLFPVIFVSVYLKYAKFLSLFEKTVKYFVSFTIILSSSPLAHSVMESSFKE